jgi:hypothetical protein
MGFCKIFFYNIIPSPLWKYQPLLLVCRIWIWFSLNVLLFDFLLNISNF